MWRTWRKFCFTILKGIFGEEKRNYMSGCWCSFTFWHKCSLVYKNRKCEFFLLCKLTHSQNVKEFLWNPRGCRKEEKKMIDYTHSWTAYTIALHKNKDILDQKMKEQCPEMNPSAKEYLGLWQVLASKWYKKQLEMRRSMYQKLAKTWNIENSLPEVQRK